MKHSILLAALPISTLLAVSTSTRAQSARPFVLDDLLGAVRIADPQLSPDGKTVLYTRTTTVVATGKRNADIYSVPADGSAPPSLFIGGEKSENTARWSADGKRVAFISTRDGAPQVYVADGEG